MNYKNKMGPRVSLNDRLKRFPRLTWDGEHGVDDFGFLAPNGGVAIGGANRVFLPIRDIVGGDCRDASHQNEEGSRSS